MLTHTVRVFIVFCFDFGISHPCRCRLVQAGQLWIITRSILFIYLSTGRCDRASWHRFRWGSIVLCLSQVGTHWLARQRWLCQPLSHRHLSVHGVWQVFCRSRWLAIPDECNNDGAWNRFKILLSFCICSSHQLIWSFELLRSLGIVFAISNCSDELNYIVFTQYKPDRSHRMHSPRRYVSKAT